MSDQKTILIVDDEASFREIIGAQLSSLGLRIVTASNSNQALSQAEKEHPDLILMDIHLSDKQTGTDVALNLKQNPKTKDIRIAFITSMKEPWPGVAGENQKIAKEIGMDDFISKTEDPQIIGERVKKILLSEDKSVAGDH